MSPLSQRAENLLARVHLDLGAQDTDPEVRRELKVRLAGSEPMDWCPPGVDEGSWRSLRQAIGDSEMRKRLWSSLNDLEPRKEMMSDE